jgi:DNA-binding CsgD family transcriptional regulator
MAQVLSNREKEVVRLLQQGKSNKLIALSLGISDRTVEFHLKNIYAKYQVNSRMELILHLGNTPGEIESENLGDSTVVDTGGNTDNRARFNSWMDWVTSFREPISTIGKEFRVKILSDSKANSGTSAMTFFDSIRVCLTKYADFNGRATRPEFWWFMLFILLVAAALANLNQVLSEIFLIGMLRPILAAGTRRLHDSGKSAWWQLFLLAPFAGIIVLGFLWALPPTSPLPDDTPAA